MTIEEQRAIMRAKEWIEDVINTHQDILNGEEPTNEEKAIFEECEVILKAMEKRIPKKPIIRLEETGFAKGRSYPYCPICDTMPIPHPKVSYCDNCGQAIDWSDEEWVE